MMEYQIIWGGCKSHESSSNEIEDMKCLVGIGIKRF